MDSYFDVDNLVRRMIKKRKWSPLNNMKDITGWNN